MKLLRHPFWQAVMVLVLAWLVIKFGIPYIPPLLGVHSAPAPASVVFEYLMIVFVGMLLYVSADESAGATFKEPIHALLVRPEQRKPARRAAGADPGAGRLDHVRSRAPVRIRAAFAALDPPGAARIQITFHGKTMTLAGLTNPLRSNDAAAMQQHYEDGKKIYYHNCLPCHGDASRRHGSLRARLQPHPGELPGQRHHRAAHRELRVLAHRQGRRRPAARRHTLEFRDARMGRLPEENEIWSVIIFLYQQTGWSPRTWEEAAPAGGAR